MTGGGGGDGETESCTPFIKSLLGASLGVKSDFWPTMPSRGQRGYQKSDPGGDHYYVGCLGQTHVFLFCFLVSFFD